MDNRHGEASGIRMELVLSPRISFAFHQNAIPVLRELTISNDGAAQLDDLELTLTMEPAFIKPRVWRIASVGAQQRYHVSELDIELDGAMLGRLSEAEHAQAVLSLRRGQDELARLEQPALLLARNQWGGIEHVPELVCAFVQPNDGAVDRVLKKAAEVLRANDKPAALDGYGAGTKARAWELASAIWSAVCSLGLDYALPPASFERAGQKVRSPGAIIEGGVATCLDLTLLFAACLEQCGLHPILVFTQGHAFAGCWLVPADFASAVVDDVTALRKRVKVTELVLFETTLAAQRPAPGFGRACELGEQHIAGAGEDTFALAVDVRRARMQRIRPLAGSDAEPHPPDSVPEVPADLAPAFEETPALVELDVPAAPADSGEAQRPEGRLARWQRKLLDLSLRNSLLNFRAVKRSLVIDAPDPGKLEDLLASGNTLRILPRPEVMEGGDPRSRAIHEARHHEDIRRAHALEALDRNQVLVGLPADQLEVRLIELYRTARDSLQESSTNTLYLALGFLAWKNDDKEERVYKAPLLLIPVSLQRTSVRAGFRLELHPDEPRFNPTLLEMLRQDFQLAIPAVENELPQDDAGLDVAKIWRAVAHAVKDIKGWEVVEDVVLSTFSFAKHLMWRDLLDRTEQIEQSRIVHHLIHTSRDPYPDTAPFPEPHTLDQDYPPTATFCPLPIDSSQLAAVMATVQGKDFVLVGPPGTGKSQTIANLIAQSLAEGRTVLFVSEKMAALDVVYRRLRDVGLGEFCLELHSSKARKLDVLAQLRQSWEARGDIDTAAWQREAARLQALRGELNTFVAHLHRPWANGLSAFAAIGRVVAGRDIPALALSWPAPNLHDRDALDTLRELADRLDVAARAAGVPDGNALAMVATGAWSPSWQRALVDTARDLIPLCSALEAAAQAFAAAAGIPLSGLAARERGALADLARVLPLAAGHDWRFVLRPDARTVFERLEAGLGRVRRRAALADQLSVSYGPEALQLDLPALHRTWAAAEATWWPRGWFLRRRVRKALAAVTMAMTVAGDKNEGKARAALQCGEDLERLLAMRAIDQELEGFRDLEAGTNGLWTGTASQEETVDEIIAFHGVLTAAIGNLAGTPDGLAQVRTALERLLGDGNVLLEPAGAVTMAGNHYVDTAERFQSALATLAGQTGAETLDIPGGDTPATVAEACGGIVAQEPTLRAWCAWRQVRAEAAAAGLLPLVEALERGDIEPGTLREVFEVNYCRWWINAVVDGEPVLRDFVSAEHERKIAELEAVDDRFTDLTQAWIRAHLCQGMPDQSSVQRSSEWGVLRREMEKKRRHMPLRRLMGEIPNVLARLSPCLLMSPLSVAQYLPPDMALFDLVVFDEASQIPVWDAIGAMTRGKQVVVVGDPKQLPPTSFFARGEQDGDEDLGVDDDLESILDECLGANLPARTLRWHYRSRHESLIAFSNHRYYGGELITFPSPVTDDRAVSFHHVADGIYEKGGARINQPEARALVTDLVAQLQDPSFVASGHTIGVVTFNSEQQRLIEDLLDEERRKNPAIEPFFAQDSLEPVFIKNLESVQGDERDVMYFSITYGADRRGHISMNFGPMNRDGGERRLNVAVTRARHALRVFATLRPEQIDLSRTQALGVRDLKHFLEFAERGPRALAEAISGPGGDFDSPFEEAVARALGEKGWQVHAQVGVSAFHIDLGVVDPDVPGSYLAGVECDGATYHRSATARDRDKLREQVLRGLGWEILRVWSTDWWIDAAGALDRLHTKLEALLDRARMARETAEAEGPAHTEATLAEQPQEATLADFQEVEPAAAAGDVDADAFFDAAYDAILLAMIGHVVDSEGPIREDVLARRIARAHDFGRVGARIRGRVLSLACREHAVTKEKIGKFLWPRSATPGVWSTFRRPGGNVTRPVDEIALPELVALARVIRGQGLDGDDAILAMARETGLQRLTRGTSRERLAEAWQHANAGTP